MYEDYRTVPSFSMIHRWRRIAGLGVVTGIVCLVFAGVIIFLASQDLGTHYNLYYLLWKSGLRRYESEVALGGLFHDHKYREHLIGMSKEDFILKFPNTFWKVVKPAPIAQPGQEWYVNDYESSRNEVGGGPAWTAIFENGRLVEFDFFKG